MKEKKVQAPVSDSVIGEIYETTDYSKFRVIIGNRKVEPSRVKNIVNSIQAVGFRMVPIVVNKKMEVIDGQGRLAALRELGMPVYYIIDHDAGIEECQWLNIGCKNWNIRDFINCYAACGDDNYIALLSLYDEYSKEVGVDTVLAVADAAYTNHVNDVVKIRQFKMKITVSEAAKRLDYLKRFTAKVEAAGGRVREMYSAILFASDVEGVDRDRLAEKFSELDIVKERGLRGSILGDLQLLEELYNYRLGNSSRLYFAHEWQVRGGGEGR